jgi:hypothetical protein
MFDYSYLNNLISSSDISERRILNAKIPYLSIVRYFTIPFGTYDLCIIVRRLPRVNKTYYKIYMIEYGERETVARMNESIKLNIDINSIKLIYFEEQKFINLFAEYYHSKYVYDNRNFRAVVQ